MPLTDRNLYAGVLVRSGEALLTFGTCRQRDLRSGNPKLVSVEPYEGGRFDGRLPVTRDSREDVLRAFAQRIKDVPDPVHRVGVATYGPVESVHEADRDADKGPDRDERRARFGRVRQQSRHVALRGLGVYQVLRDGLGGVTPEIVLQTDVNCGALHEAFARMREAKSPRPYQRQDPSEVLLFYNIAEGIGGSFVIGLRPWSGALHPEMGCVPAQVRPGDMWGQDLLKKRARTGKAVFIQELVAEDALLARADVSKLADVPVGIWKLAANYIAQLCATGCVTLAPHQIVLHGSVVHEAPIDMIKLVQEDFGEWLGTGSAGPIISYGRMTRSELFIDKPVFWSTEQAKEGKAQPDPMLGGAIILAMQKDLRRSDNDNQA